MLSDAFEAVHLAFIKRFEFPEPVFCPEKLKRGKIFSKEGCRFFCDPNEINKRINSLDKVQLPVGILKPIKNLKIPEDNFWKPFRYEELGPQLTHRRELPYYPFQVLPDQTTVSIDEGSIKKITGMDIVDVKVNAQIRLFPPGIGTAHVYLYLKSKALDTDQLLNLTSDPRSIRIAFHGKKKNLFKFFNSFINMTVNHISEREHARDIPGYFLLFNFQGKGPESLSAEIAEDLSKILQNRSPLRKGEVKRITEEDNFAGRKTDADLIFLSDRTAVLFVDEGIRSLGHSRILKGRRCFRTHFLNTVEMAYNTQWLLTYYTDYLNKMLHEVESVSIGKGARDRIKQIMVANIFDPCIYSTLIRTILPIHNNLKKISTFYADVFAQAAAALKIPALRAALEAPTKKLYEKASEWKVQEEFFKKVYEELAPLVVSPLGGGVERLLGIVVDKVVDKAEEKLKGPPEDESDDTLGF